MRKLRPAYRKTMKTIHSCRTIEQLLCSYRMVENFNRMFPRAKRFTWNLYSEVCRRLGDEVKNVQEIT